MAQTKIYTIKEFREIPGKDRIHTCLLNETAYEFIVQKSETFKVGDPVLMILNDSLIPENKRTKALSCYDMLKEKFFNEKLNSIRTRVVKFAGFRSVGLLENIENIGKKVSVGDELDDYFGITKYEPDELEATPTKGKNTWKSKLKAFLFKHFPKIAKLIYGKNNVRLQYPFPSDYIAKSDEENAQNIVDLIEYHKNDPCIITLKMEGQSGTYLFKDKEFLVCSRNLAYEWSTYGDKNPEVSGRSTSNYFEVAKNYKLKEAIEKYKELTGHDIVIQGELLGGDIQKNIYHFPTLRYFIYRIKDMTEKRILNVDEVTKVIEVLNSNGFNLEQVPVVARFDHLSNFLTKDNIEEVVNWFESHNYFEPATDTSDWKWSYGEGKANQKTKFMNEGIVIYCGDFSFKLKSLAYKEWFA